MSAANCCGQQPRQHAAAKPAPSSSRPPSSVAVAGTPRRPAPLPSEDVVASGCASGHVLAADVVVVFVVVVAGAGAAVAVAGAAGVAAADAGPAVVVAAAECRQNLEPAVALLHVEDANTPENMDPSLRVSPAPAFGVQLRVLLLQLVAAMGLGPVPRPFHPD